MTELPAASHKLINRIVATFLQGNMSIVFIFISMMAGIAALSITPREEDPQIVVPMADVMISMPGASAQEVERQVSTPLEKLLYQIPGVEYVYSVSNPAMSIVTVRYYVGEDLERSWVKLYNKINSNIDKVPPGVSGWVVKPKEIDDVPIAAITLYSARYSDYELRRMAEEMEIRLQANLHFLCHPAQLVVAVAGTVKRDGRDGHIVDFLGFDHPAADPRRHLVDVGIDLIVKFHPASFQVFTDVISDRDNRHRRIADGIDVLYTGNLIEQLLEGG